jgi:hypothetical protein
VPDNEYSEKEHVTPSKYKLSTSFLVGVDVDDSGNPIFGNGSDIDPYVIGATSLNLLKRLVLFQESNQQTMLHIHSTFKFTRNSYPLLVIGISDINRKFFF